MIVSRKNIPEAIELEKARAIIWNSQKHDNTRDDSKVVPYVFVQRHSFKMYKVCWHLTNLTTTVGEVQKDNTKYPNQEIVWVWDNSPSNNRVYSEMKFKLMLEDNLTPITITKKDAMRFMDRYDRMGADVKNRTSINITDIVANFIKHIQDDYSDHLETLESERKMKVFDEYVKENKQRLAEKRQKRLDRNKKASRNKSLFLTKNNNDTRLWT